MREGVEALTGKSDTTRPISRWEYRYFPQSHNEGENLTALNAMGSDGWEVCHVGRINYLLKRQVS
jgi:hypothetical protein